MKDREAEMLKMSLTEANAELVGLRTKLHVYYDALVKMAEDTGAELGDYIDLPILPKKFSDIISKDL